ncbi:protein of unknown function [Streptantibioticus cattleyicolor NRRL 8057 = DSM 46488]|nr:protein of unknown function [Streptantibioticus cattleyicolor NRRL 8057 = DSM 46488]
MTLAVAGERLCSQSSRALMPTIDKLRGVSGFAWRASGARVTLFSSYGAGGPILVTLGA